MSRLGKSWVQVSVLFFSVMVGVTQTEGQKAADRLTARTGAKIVVCHATGSKENPYETVEVSDNGVAHRRHPADIVPAPADGCPGPGGGEPTEPVPEPLTMLLFGAGVAGVGYTARKLKRKR